MNQNYIFNSRQQVEEARRGAVRKDQTVAQNQELLAGVITALNGGGYDVSIVSAEGESTGGFSRLFPYPAQTTLNVGDAVYVLRNPNDDPVILAAGGGGGGCQQAVNSWGVLR